MGVDSLQPAVAHLVEIVEVVLGEAVALIAGAGSVGNSHTLSPAIVLAKGLGEVATKAIEGGAEVLCTSVNIEIGVPAAVGRMAAIALVGRDLHEALLAVSANRVLVTGGLLHSDGGEENGGKVVLTGGLVEGVEVGPAGAVGITRLGKDVVEVLGDQIID